MVFDEFGSRPDCGTVIFPANGVVSPTKQQLDNVLPAGTTVRLDRTLFYKEHVVLISGPYVIPVAIVETGESQGREVDLSRLTSNYSHNCLDRDLLEKE